MSRPILTKIVLQNYRNFAYKEILVGENGLILQGKNGLGKTNVIEAVYRNMSGKLFDGSARSETQDVTPKGAEKDVKTSVKLHFEKDNFTFELISYDEFKKDGSFKGVANDYYVNEQLTKKGLAVELLENYLGIKNTYNRWVTSGVKNINLIDLLFNIDTLKHIDYKDLRALVVDMVGDVSIHDVISANPTKYNKLAIELSQNGEDLEKVRAIKSVAKFGKANEFGLEDKIKAVRDTINNLEKTANQTYDKALVETAKNDLKVLEDKIIELKVKARQGANEQVSSIDLEISKLEKDLMIEENRIRDEHRKTVESLKDTATQNAINEKRQSLLNLKNDLTTINNNINNKKYEANGVYQNLEAKKQEKARLQTTKGDLITQYNEAKAPKQSETVTCPHCDKPFALHDTKEHKEIIKNRIDDIVKRGKEVASQIEQLTEAIETLTTNHELKQGEIIKLQNDRSQKETNIQALESEIKALEVKLQETNKNAPNLDLNSDLVLSIKLNIQTLNTRKQTALTDYQATINALTSQIAELEAQKQPLQTVINQEIIVEQYKRDVEAKRKELAKLQSDLIDVNDILALIKSVEQEKYQAIELKVANTFGENIKFELFKENIDGTYDTRVCVMLVKDIRGNFVRIENLNTGLYPIRAIEFINIVRDFYNIPKSFIFVDELSALDTQHTKMLLASGLQIIATRPSDSETLEEIEIK